MVGPCGLEPQTSSVSGKRSNQLSYGPVPTGANFLTQTCGVAIGKAMFSALESCKADIYCREKL